MVRGSSSIVAHNAYSDIMGTDGISAEIILLNPSTARAAWGYKDFTSYSHAQRRTSSSPNLNQ